MSWLMVNLWTTWYLIPSLCIQLYGMTQCLILHQALFYNLVFNPFDSASSLMLCMVWCLTHLTQYYASMFNTAWIVQYTLFYSLCMYSEFAAWPIWHVNSSHPKAIISDSKCLGNSKNLKLSQSSETYKFLSILMYAILMYVEKVIGWIFMWCAKMLQHTLGLCLRLNCSRWR